ncbi:hypothetical protein M5D96_008399 [Drosophila gunungcola]|uniref:Uncharacterized protein n=1 Tax=Drosophila gunungcola TaxID=103775 RepID=A0A9P9YK68_9MUSC|nr:hypothetical protein M5D96_008399 [Drosophila gunungcola]
MSVGVSCCTKEQHMSTLMRKLSRAILLLTNWVMPYKFNSQQSALNDVSRKPHL